jgi:hypothetical protein
MLAVLVALALCGGGQQGGSHSAFGLERIRVREGRTRNPKPPWSLVGRIDPKATTVVTFDRIARKIDHGESGEDGSSSRAAPG